jgi:hypothetical protein
MWAPYVRSTSKRKSKPLGEEICTHLVSSGRKMREVKLIFVIDEDEGGKMDFFLVEFASKILCCLLRFMDRNYFLGRHRPRTHTHKRKEKTSVVPTAVRDNKHSFASTSFVLLRFCASPMCQVPTGEPK